VVAVIGRDDELATLTDFVRRLPASPAAILVEGEAGIGKTTLWEWGVAEAQRLDFRVLSSRPLAAERQLSFNALGDLLEDALDGVLPQIPPPQRHALEVALLRTEPGESAPDRRALSLAFRTVIRLLATERPLLLALDDLQWLDRSSSRVLAFALRRLMGEPIGILATLREGEGDENHQLLRQALPAGTLVRLPVTPLDGAVVTRLLRSRLGAEALSFPILEQVASTSAGNPFLAIQITEILVARGARPEPGEPLPVPEDRRTVIQARIDTLSTDARNSLGVCALSACPTIRVVAAILGEARARAGLREASDAGVVRVDGGQVSFAHPLLTAAAYNSMTLGQRRIYHRGLAAAVCDPEQRGRHLALAADGPDPSVASALDAAAHQARGRGAPATAAELVELALRLTESDDATCRHLRTLKASEYHFEAGDVERARSLLKELEVDLPPGPARAEALLYLCDSLWCDLRRIRPLLERALRDIGDGGRLELRIEALVDLAWVGILGGDLPEGARRARAALELAERLNHPAYLSRALLACGHAEFFMGREAGPTMARAVALQHALEGRQMLTSPRRKLGAHLMWAGDLDAARTELERDRRDTLQRGQLTDLGEIVAHLAELEIRAGNWDRAAAYAAEGCESMIDAGFETALEIPLSTLALVEARRGEVEPSRTHALQGLRLAEIHEYRFEVIRNRSVLGFLELSLGNASAARGYLAPLPLLTEAMGLKEPSVFPFVPDLVEALVRLGKVEEAEPLVMLLEERGRERNRSLALATAARCRGLIAAARGDFRVAVHELEKALVTHEGVQQPFELARTLLMLGEVRRRGKEKRVAREALRAAREIFEHLGARLWSEGARDELRRVGDRARASTDLTPTEQRVAALVSEGRTNREVAGALFISVRTVEANLSRIYQKKGIRSRTELARRVASSSDSRGGENGW
jgi:DNA-binding CsgD family transcriptional regulator